MWFPEIFKLKTTKTEICPNCGEMKLLFEGTRWFGNQCKQVRWCNDCLDSYEYYPDTDGV